MMMTRIGELTAGEWCETIDGREWRFAPLSLADWAELEARLVASRPDPLAVARDASESLPAAAHRGVLEAAFAEACRATRVTIDELVEFAASGAGTVLLCWLALRRHHPELSEADVAALISRWTDAEVSSAHTRLAGAPPGAYGPAKNSRRQATATSPSPGA